MAVTKTLTKALPYCKDSKVEKWEFEMKYEEGDKTWNEETQEWVYAADYFTSTMWTEIPATHPKTGVVNFTPKTEALWTLAELTALCPTDKWDDTFDSQYDSVITSPPDLPEPDSDYVMPS